MGPADLTDTTRPLKSLVLARQQVDGTGGIQHEVTVKVEDDD